MKKKKQKQKQKTTNPGDNVVEVDESLFEDLEDDIGLALKVPVFLGRWLIFHYLVRRCRILQNCCQRRQRKVQPSVVGNRLEARQESKCLRITLELEEVLLHG